MASGNVIADVTRLPEHPSLVTSSRRRRIWIWLIAVVALMVATFLPRVAAQTTASDAVPRPTNQVENSTLPSPASNVSVTSGTPAPKRIIVDDPPPPSGTKRKARILAGFALTIISLLVLVVGIGVLRAFRQR